MADEAKAWSEQRGFQIRFDGPPGATSGRFVETEDLSGVGISIGEWVQDSNGDWLLRIMAHEAEVETQFYPCGHQKSAGGIEQHDCK